VNQDDVSAYHLFYADGKGSPGTDITFFDWPAMRERRGTGSVVRTAVRVRSEASLHYWSERLAALGVPVREVIERAGRASLDFEDAEGQRLSMVVDSGVGESNPWQRSTVPIEHQILGLGPVTISVPELAPTQRVLEDLLGMRLLRQYSTPVSDRRAGAVPAHVFTMGPGGASAELHVVVEASLPQARQGAGAVHHVAFRVPTFAEYDQWDERFREYGVRSSGPIDRFYFRSLYFREQSGILFELATDEPGFATDESMETLGESLSLPSFLEGRRTQIEAGLKEL